MNDRDFLLMSISFILVIAIIVVLAIGWTTKSQWQHENKALDQFQKDIFGGT